MERVRINLFDIPVMSRRMNNNHNNQSNLCPNVFDSFQLAFRSAQTHAGNIREQVEGLLHLHDLPSSWKPIDVIDEGKWCRNHSGRQPEMEAMGAMSAILQYLRSSGYRFNLSRCVQVSR